MPALGRPINDNCVCERPPRIQKHRMMIISVWGFNLTLPLVAASAPGRENDQSISRWLERRTEFAGQPPQIDPSSLDSALLNSVRVRRANPTMTIPRAESKHDTSGVLAEKIISMSLAVIGERERSARSLAGLARQLGCSISAARGARNWRTTNNDS